MRVKPNWNELEARLDFASLDQKLHNLIASGQLKRRKTASDLLDKVKDAVIQARAKGVSIATLAAFLKENGLPVSEPTLRHYLRVQGVRKRMRRTKPHSQSAKPLAPVSSASSKAEPQTAMTHPPKAPLNMRHRGPRIADTKNL